MSALLLALGMYRMELFAIISGAVLLVCLLFALINLGLSLFFVAERNPAFTAKRKTIYGYSSKQKKYISAHTSGSCVFFMN
ncbi:hypothetical protein [Treponema phagedenis]|uniref:hypothetical protein n=2 Tax=Treponema phagedenis TaxID=162 RepID=UPI0015A720EC|nr:hypothetical protein [Treponema phagedenis]NVP25726.1 hypothetical protein [Treponema phagedenis]